MSAAQWRVAVIGECMIELLRDGGGIVQTFGGDSFNAAAYLARVCGSAARVEYVSAVGDGDPYSLAMLDFWSGCGVGSSLTQRLSGKLPGLYAIEVDERGERHFLYWRGEAAVKGCFETPQAEAVLERLGEADLIHLSGVSLAVLYPQSRERLLTRLEELAACGTHLSFDFNFRPRLWGPEPEAAARPWYERLARCCRTLFLSREEGCAVGCPDAVGPTGHTGPASPAGATGTAGAGGYTQGFIECLRALGADEVVVKDGGGPCLVVQKDRASAFPMERIAAVDTTAAGDAFAAAYLASRHRGLDVAAAMERAHKLASTVIMHRGAIIPDNVMPRIF